MPSPSHPTASPVAARAAALLTLLTLALPLACDRGGGVDGQALPGAGDDAGQTVLYRDEWGVAHIYSPTIVGGLYAMGWAQAEDRPTQLLHNLMIAIGEYASVVGEAAVPSDLRAHMWDHYAIGQRRFAEMQDPLRAEIAAFTRGINDFYVAHPDDVPEWWRGRQVDEAMVLAFGRLFLSNWSIDEAYEDLVRSGVRPEWERTARGSNQFAIAPERSAEGAAILAIDPHLAWEGPSRFWELRVHAGELVGSGVSLAGSPYIGLGHNRDVAWAMTTGGPDTADVYRLKVRNLSGDSTADQQPAPEMLYDGQWLPLEARTVELAVQGAGAQTHTLWFSPHHGPLIAQQGDEAFAARIAYGDLVTLEAWRTFNLAEDYTGAVAAMDSLTLFPQNVMVADTSGNIYYQRTGRVPRRPAGFDWSLPVDGSTSASEWNGFHPASDHLQVLNPRQGWMQNCNIPPDAMMPESPFQLADHVDYLFSGPGYGRERAGWTNQRGARAVELLAGDDSVTAEEAMAYINDVQPYGAERWLEALRQAHEAVGEARYAEHQHYDAAIDDLLGWNGALQADSSGALKFDLWKEQVFAEENRDAGAALGDEIDQLYLTAVQRREAPEIELDAAESGLLVDAFARAMDVLVEKYGSLQATYGDRYRVGRGEQSWPVGGGGGRGGTTTLRNMGYGAERDDFTRWGRSGQTSTQVVVMTEPPQSWMYLPLGQSDRPDSPHFADQAEKLFSQRELKPTRWRPEELAGHTTSRTVLDKAP